MKRGSLVAACIVALCVLVASSLSADEVAENLQSVVLETFDNPDESRWIVRGSKFLAEGDEYEVPFRFQYVEAWPRALYREEPEDFTPQSLGVQASFTRRGYNYLEFIPVEAEDDQDGNPVPRAINIPGRVQNLDLWVWGSNHDYYMEVQLRDHRGVVHVLELGRINFRGWRNLRVRIPTYISQSVQYVPQLQTLELVKLVLWTVPSERVDGFWVYLDQVKVFTDVFESPFDGESLANPERIEEIWNTGGGE